MTESRDPRRLRTRPPARIGVNLASMIDVVFLLLIYFMVATEFRRGEDVFRLDLPPRRGEANAHLWAQSKEPLVVRVNAEAVASEGIAITLDGPWPRISDPAALNLFLRTHLVGNASDGKGLFTSTHPVVIVGSRRVAWTHVVGVFNAVVGAGYDAVSLEVE